MRTESRTIGSCWGHELPRRGSGAQLGLLLPNSPASAECQSGLLQRAFVIEKDLSRITFENDGTNTRESTSRIRIQSDAGVQQYSVLTAAYAKAEQSVDFDYVGW